MKNFSKFCWVFVLRQESEMFKAACAMSNESNWRFPSGTGSPHNVHECMGNAHVTDKVNIDAKQQFKAHQTSTFYTLFPSKVFIALSKIKFNSAEGVLIRYCASVRKYLSKIFFVKRGLIRGSIDHYVQQCGTLALKEAQKYLTFLIQLDFEAHSNESPNRLFKKGLKYRLV